MARGARVSATRLPSEPRHPARAVTLYPRAPREPAAPVADPRVVQASPVVIALTMGIHDVLMRYPPRTAEGDHEKRTPRPTAALAGPGVDETEIEKRQNPPEFPSTMTSRCLRAFPHLTFRLPPAWVIDGGPPLR